MSALLRFPFYVLLAWATLALLAFCSVANAQQSGTATATEAGEFTWEFTYDTETEVLTLVLTRTGGYDPGWYGGNYVWGVEASLWAGGFVLSPNSITGSLSTGASQTQTRYYEGVSPGTELTLTFNGRHAGNGSADIFTPHEAVYVAGSEIEEPPDKVVNIALRNTSDWEITYVLVQDGDPVGSVTLQPGEAIIQQMTVPGDSDVVVVAQVPGLSYDGDNWFVVEDAVYEQQVTPPLTPQIEPPLQPFVVPQPTIPQNAKNPANNPSGGGGIPPWPIEEEGEVKNPNKDKPVWKHDDPNEDPDGQVDLLTNKIFREGIEKLLENGGAEGPEELEPGEAEEAPTVPAPDMVGKFALPTLPTSIGTVTTLSATIPGFNVSGVGWPSYDWTFDLDDHASAVSLVRGIFAGILYICYFILCVRTIRGAAASEN